MEISSSTTSKSIRKTLEKKVEDIVDNHVAFKSNPFLISIDSIVENIMKSEEMKILAEKFYSEQSSINDGSSSDEYHDFIDFEKQAKMLDSQDTELEMFEDIPLHSISDQKVWARKAKILRDRLLSKHNELFESSYSLHLQLLMNPQTLNEGILNLIRALKTYFLSASKQYLSNNFRINLKMYAHTNLLKIINLLLKSLSRIHKNYKNQVIESIIIQLLELISFPTISRKIDRIHVLNFMAILDPEALWFKNIFFNTFDRKVIITFFKKNTSLVEYLVTEIFTNMYEDNDLYMKHVYIDQKCEIITSIIKAATFYHCLYIVGELLCYSQGRAIFPIKIRLNNKEVCTYSLVTVFLDAINAFHDIPSLKLKKMMLISILKRILVSNSYLLKCPDIMQKFLTPLQIVDNSKQLLSEVAFKNLYIFEICEKISTLKDGYLLLFGFSRNSSKNKSKKNTTKPLTDEPETIYPANVLDKMVKQYLNKEGETSSPADMLINFSISFLRHYINNHKKFTIDYDLPFKILDHCREILSCQGHILHWYKTQRLIACVRDLYKFLSGQKGYAHLIRNLEKFIYIVCIASRSLNYLQDEQDIFFLFGLNYLNSPNNKFWEQKHFNIFILNLADNIYGSEAIYEKMEKIVSPVLDNIWKIMENQMIFLSGSDRLINEAIFKYLRMVVTFTFSMKCFQVVLKENIDDITVQTDQNDQKPMNLCDLLDDTLHESGPGNIVNYVGLITLKMVLLNLDIYLYMENKFKIIDKLVTLQKDCTLPPRECTSAKEGSRSRSRSLSPFIIDECSLIRQEIIDQIENMGRISGKSQSAKKYSNTNITTSRKQINELQRFLKDSKNNLHDNSWMLQARRAHKLVLDDVMKEIIMFEVIKQASLISPTNKSEFVWPSPEAELKDLHPEEFIGVTFIINYGLQNKLIQNCLQNEDSLILLLKQTRLFLKQPKEVFCGFDWLTGIVFLICGGNIDKSKIILSCLVDLPISSYIWPALRTHDKSLCWMKFELNINIILHEVENLDTIMDASYISTIGLARYLLNQCFLNIFEWNEICHFIIMCSIYTPDYLVYYFVTIFQNIKPHAIEACIFHDLTIYDKILHLEGFKMKNAIPVMESLAKQYKHLIN